MKIFEFVYRRIPGCLFDSKALRCSANWRAALNRGGRIFQSRDSHLAIIVIQI